jgi:hypothetical protein
MAASSDVTNVSCTSAGLAVGSFANYALLVIMLHVTPKSDVNTLEVCEVCKDRRTQRSS